MTYKKQMGLAIAGLAVCALPVFLPLIPKTTAWMESERVKAESQLQAQNLETKEVLARKRIEERGKTSEALLSAGVLPTTKSVRLTNYFDSSQKRPRPDTSVYQADEIINVFDATGFCIGRIEEGRFKWKYDYQGSICEGVQNVESINRGKKL